MYNRAKVRLSFKKKHLTEIKLLIEYYRIKYPYLILNEEDDTELKKKGLSFISNRQRRKEGTFSASELAGIEPTPPAPEEQGMPAFAN